MCGGETYTCYPTTSGRLPITINLNVNCPPTKSTDLVCTKSSSSLLDIKTPTVDIPKKVDWSYKVDVPKKVDWSYKVETDTYKKSPSLLSLYTPTPPPPRTTDVSITTTYDSTPRKVYEGPAGTYTKYLRERSIDDNILLTSRYTHPAFSTLKKSYELEDIYSSYPVRSKSILIHDKAAEYANKNYVRKSYTTPYVDYQLTTRKSYLDDVNIDIKPYKSGIYSGVDGTEVKINEPFDPASDYETEVKLIEPDIYDYSLYRSKALDDFDVEKKPLTSYYTVHPPTYNKVYRWGARCSDGDVLVKHTVKSPRFTTRTPLPPKTPRSSSGRLRKTVRFVDYY